MRWIALFLLVMGPTAFANDLSSPAVAAGLCKAAATDGQLEPAVEALVDKGQFTGDDGPALLKVDCGGGRNLLEVMVDGRQSENFEYAVIDVGVDVNAPLLAGKTGKVSLLQWMSQRADQQRTPAQRKFLRDYVANLRDVNFNPGLELSLTRR